MSIIEVFSGGSGDRPKSIPRPVSTWEISAELEQRVWGMSRGDRFLVLADPGHSLWPYVFFRARCLAGDEACCHGVSPADLCSSQALAWLKHVFGIATVVYAVPALLQLAARILGAPLHPPLSFNGVRLILLGGSYQHLQRSEIEAFFPSAQIKRFYGTAECSFIGHGSVEAGSDMDQAGYCFFPEVEARVDAMEQLWIRSPMTVSPSQWHATGDRVLLSGHCLQQPEAANGPLSTQFKWLGRTDRLINVSGNKHSPEAAERTLQRVFSHPELAVVGQPDPRRGERAFLVYRDTKDWDFQRLTQSRRLLATHHPEFPTLASMLRVMDWPMMSNGKLAHHRLLRTAR